MTRDGSGSEIHLFDRSSEYMQMLRHLGTTPRLRVAFAGRAAAVYAYEMTERLLELARGPAHSAGFAAVAPFWPPALARAAGIAPAIVAACLRRWPVGMRISGIRPARDELAIASDLALAGAWFDEDHYLLHLESEVLLDDARTPSKATSAIAFLRDGRVLLERRPLTARVDPGMWDTPGGHLEPGETPAAALIRETNEELGIVPIEPELVAIQAASSGGVPYRHYAYIAGAWAGELSARTGAELRWIDVRSVAALADVNPRVVELIEQLYGRTR